MKFAFTFAILLLALVYCADAEKNDQNWGKRGEGDIKVYHKIHSKPGSFLQVQRGTLDYQANNTITYIEATDQLADGLGGFALLAEGGPDTKEVSIDFKSKRGKGYNFIVDIWVKGN